MPLKLNVSEKGKAWKIEVEPSLLEGKSIGDKINGKEIKPELDGYELEITGGSDMAGFPLFEKVEGTTLKRVLLTRGWGMHKKPKKEGKRKVPTPHGLRLRKTVRGKTVSKTTAQLNIKVIKNGKTSLTEIFPEQNKPKEKAQKKTEEPSSQKAQ